MTAVLRLFRRGGWHGMRVALWSAWCCRRVRWQLSHGGIDLIRLSAPPRPADRDRRIAVAVLRRTRASCLERSLVLQRWHAGQRISRVLLIGVTAPSRGFHAHAWLEGDPDGVPGMVVILRRPPQRAWLPAGQDR
jgi:transglutaminase superfamily protein